MWIGYEGLGTSTVSPRSRQASIRWARPSFEPMVTMASESMSNWTPYLRWYQSQIALRRRGMPLETE